MKDNWLTDARLNALTAMTDGAHRFLGLGFRLFDVRAAYHPSVDDIVLGARFVCVCGREEHWSQIPDKHCALEWQNIYDSIVRFGATSRRHLLEDKYSVEQIDAMEARLRNFEMTPQIAERAWRDVRGLRYAEVQPLRIRMPVVG